MLKILAERWRQGHRTSVMGTLGGLAMHSAPAPHPATPALRAASPNPPAVWLQANRPWAKPAYAYAIMGTARLGALSHAENSR